MSGGRKNIAEPQLRGGEGAICLILSWHNQNPLTPPPSLGSKL